MFFPNSGKGNHLNTMQVQSNGKRICLIYHNRAATGKKKHLLQTLSMTSLVDVLITDHLDLDTFGHYKINSSEEQV